MAFRGLVSSRNDKARTTACCSPPPRSPLSLSRLLSSSLRSWFGMSCRGADDESPRRPLSPAPDRARTLGAKRAKSVLERVAGRVKEPKALPSPTAAVRERGQDGNCVLDFEFQLLLGVERPNLLEPNPVAA